MSKSTAIATRNKPKEVVNYVDTHGNRWTATVGEPNGCFTIAGDARVFSTQSLLNWIAKNVAVARMENADTKIEGPFDLQLEDAMDLAGIPKKAAAQVKAPAGKPTTQIGPMVAQAFKTAKSKGLYKLAGDGSLALTKAELADAGEMTMYYIQKAIESGELVDAGKSGNSKLYKQA